MSFLDKLDELVLTNRSSRTGRFIKKTAKIIPIFPDLYLDQKWAYHTQIAKQIMIYYDKEKRTFPKYAKGRYLDGYLNSPAWELFKLDFQIYMYWVLEVRECEHCKIPLEQNEIIPHHIPQSKKRPYNFNFLCHPHLNGKTIIESVCDDCHNKTHRGMKND